MTTPPPFRPGISTLLTRHRRWLTGKRVALVSHQAAVDEHGLSSAERLWLTEGIDLTTILGPEHGYFGGAGETIRSRRHPRFGIPVYSLYGRARRPTPRMLRDCDIIVIDLQDLGARCYTYVSTIQEVLIAAERAQLPVIVADRPIPLACTPDGPPLADGFESFVASIPAPMLYAMTPGEAAGWMADTLGLNIDIRVALANGYNRDPSRNRSWPPWIPPSPGIVTWEAAQAYTSTVFTEAVPAIDCGRGSGLSFQLIGAPWINPAGVAEALDDLSLPGVTFHEHRYSPRVGRYASRPLDGLRMVITSPARFRPILTSVCILSVLQKLYGINRLWRAPKTRPRFFDALYGTDSVRTALLDGVPGPKIAGTWQRGLKKFRSTRSRHLLY
jgi:uncharacterized protein YbbC (DUF1343 family)